MDDRKSERTKQTNKTGDIEKWDQTNSPEIPQGGDIRNPPASLQGGPKMVNAGACFVSCSGFCYSNHINYKTYPSMHMLSFFKQA